MSSNAFDVVVVGSGPAGTAFARTLADIAPDASILMVECGPLVSAPAGRHVRRTANPAERERAQIASQGPLRSRFGLPPARVIAPDADGRLPVGIRPGTFLISDGMTASDSTGFPAGVMSSNVGGMGAHWSCACPAPGPGELIPFIPPDEFARSLEASYGLLSVTQHAFDGSELARGVTSALGERFDPVLSRPVQAMPLALTPDAHGHLGLAGTEKMLAPLLASPAERFELRPDTLATSLIREGDRVVGVRLRDLVSREEYSVSCGHVFIAADAYRTPQLLHTSGIRPPALGRYLNDHLDARSFVQLDDRFHGLARGDSEVAVGGLARDAGVTWIPFDQASFPYSVQVMQLDASPIALDESGAPWPGAYVGVVLFGCKDLSPNDRIEFSETETDAYGMPALRIRYELNNRDWTTVDGMFAAHEQIGKALGRFIGGGPALIQDGGSYHIMGSVRMGETDDGASVCDPYGGVWGVEGLSVGGNGVIPTATACNPTATTVALASRSAAHVARN
jgi:choline dehydrogenase-like flavoprotein